MTTPDLALNGHVERLDVNTLPAHLVRSIGGSNWKNARCFMLPHDTDRASAHRAFTYTFYVWSGARLVTDYEFNQDFLSS